MTQLIRLEFVKLVRSRFMFILIGLVFIFLIGYFFYVDQREMAIEDMEEVIHKNTENSKMMLEQLNAEVKSLEEAEKMVPSQLQMLLNNTQTQLEAYVLMSEGIKNQDWSTYLQGEILNNIKLEEDKRKELEQVEKSYQWPTPFTIFTGMDSLRWMEERNIRPTFQSSYYSWMTIYDEEFSEPLLEEMITKHANKYSSSGFHFTYEVFKYVFSLIGVLLFIFLFGDILTREGFGKNGPIHLIRTQPIKRWKFWASKGLTVIGGSLLIMLGIFVISLTMGTVLNRLGDWDYPILIYGENRTYSLLPLAVFLGKALGLFMLILGFAFSLLFLFSIVTNRGILAIGLTIIVLFGGQMLTDQAELLSWAHWLPFQYFDIYGLVSGEFAILQNNMHLTYDTAVISFSISIVLILIITFIVGRLRKGVIS